EAGHVHQQVAHGHRPLRVDELLRAVRRSLADLEVAPLRDEPRHGVAQLEHPALVQRHQRDAGDRLGHRVDAPDRVLLDRRGPLEVPGPERAEVADVPVPRDRGLAAGDAAGVDVPVLQVVGDPLELPLVQSRARWIDLHALLPPGPGPSLACGSHVTGSSCTLVMVIFSLYLSSSKPAARRSPGSRPSRPRNASRSSMRASWAPRQWWAPMPNAICVPGGRVTSRRSGSAKTDRAPVCGPYIVA